MDDSAVALNDHEVDDGHNPDDSSKDYPRAHIEGFREDGFVHDRTPIIGNLAADRSMLVNTVVNYTPFQPHDIQQTSPERHHDRLNSPPHPTIKTGYVYIKKHSTAQVSDDNIFSNNINASRSSRWDSQARGARTTLSNKPSAIQAAEQGLVSQQLTANGVVRGQVRIDSPQTPSSTTRLENEAVHHNQLQHMPLDQHPQDRVGIEQEDMQLQQMLLAQQRQKRKKRQREEQDELLRTGTMRAYAPFYDIGAQQPQANRVERFEAPRNEQARQQIYANYALFETQADKEYNARSLKASSKIAGGSSYVAANSSFSIEDGAHGALCTSSFGENASSAGLPFHSDVNPQPPLKTIRLLKLLSSNGSTASGGGAPAYSLESFPYSPHLEYVALSYVWGEESITSTVRVNGELVQVRINLGQALSSIRESDPEIYLWADALCINQQDDKEKSNLVQHMGEIFANAQRVYAWLGEVEKATPETSTQYLFTHLSDLGGLFWKHAGSVELNKCSLDLDSILTKNLDAVFAKFAQPPGPQGGFPTEEYSSFSARPYWSRIWVLQEVFLAKDLYYICGSCRLPSKELAGALILLETFQSYLIRAQGSVREQIESNDLLWKFAFGFPSFPEMHRLIIYTSIYPQDVISLRIAMTNFCVKELPRGSRATDPRDMIYGLLGFANIQERSYILADYGKSVQEIYVATTRALIDRGFTDVLAWAQPETKRISHLPSWVPDYSATIYESLCSQGQAKAWLPQFKAGGQYGIETAQPFDDNTLSVCGRRLGKVLRIGQLWFPRLRRSFTSSSAGTSGTLHARSASYDEILSFLIEIQELALHAENLCGSRVATEEGDSLNSVHWRDSMWRVPCCDQIVVDGRLVHQDPSTHSRYEATLTGLQACVKEPKTKLPAKSWPYVNTLLRWVNKRPFLTSSGYVGLGPAGIRPGDPVVILDGFSACYILRRQENNRYCFVGEAFVDGAMNGEMANYAPYHRDWFHLV
ncbi:heterokaryon incompatibility protein-domain-containing protein [Xylariaceae sp. FL1651]|nr:heterokaryon incompatibility protein-domain-containing protein [Xylariaceae sp. FL1651]